MTDWKWKPWAGTMLVTAPRIISRPDGQRTVEVRGGVQRISEASFRPMVIVDFITPDSSRSEAVNARPRKTARRAQRQAGEMAAEVFAQIEEEL